MARKKKLTTLQSAYEKERRRIKRYIRKYEKLGYEINVTVPDRPKRVTQKQLRLIREIKPKYIQSRSIVLNPETGEVLTGTQYQKEVRRARLEARKNNKAFYNLGVDASYSDESEKAYQNALGIIDNFLFGLNAFPQRVRLKLGGMIQRAQNMAGAEEVAQALQATSSVFKDMTQQLARGYEEDIQRASSIILNHIPDITQGLRDELEYSFFEEASFE